MRRHFRPEMLRCGWQGRSKIMGSKGKKKTVMVYRFLEGAEDRGLARAISEDLTAGRRGVRL
jgi:hypothetical protein